MRLGLEAQIFISIKENKAKNNYIKFAENRVYKPTPDNIRHKMPNMVKHWTYIYLWAIIDI